MTITVACPGSCGELFQCVVGENEALLSYGIEKWSIASLTECNDSPMLCETKLKTKHALEHLPKTLGVQIQQNSQLAIGKGYSSSSADMIAALQALAIYQNNPKNAAELTKICSQIEATDSVAFKDWTVIDPLSGAVLWQTDWKPTLYVYILEPIESVNTIDLIRMKECPSYPKKQSEHLFHLFKEACLEKNIEKLGSLATKSAILNNKRLPKPYLREILHLAKKHHCLGVNVAHSGTLVGLLLTLEQVEKINELEKDIASHHFSHYYQQRSLSRILFEGVQERSQPS